MTQPQPLTFEEFVARGLVLKGHPRYDNFFSHFTTMGVAAQFIRSQPYMVRFTKEHPDLEEKLREGVMNRNKLIETIGALKPIEGDLYKAYLIMHGYGIPDDVLMIAPK